MEYEVINLQTVLDITKYENHEQGTFLPEVLHDNLFFLSQSFHKCSDFSANITKLFNYATIFF